MVRRAQLDDGSLRRCFRDALERPVLEAGGDIPPVAVRDRFAAAGEGRLEEPAGECYRLRAVQVHRYEPAGGPAVDDADVLAVVEVARGVLEADAEVLPVRDPWALLAGWYRDRRPTALYVAGRGLRATHAMRRVLGYNGHRTSFMGIGGWVGASWVLALFFCLLSIYSGFELLAALFQVGGGLFLSPGRKFVGLSQRLQSLLPEPYGGLREQRNACHHPQVLPCASQGLAVFNDPPDYLVGLLLHISYPVCCSGGIPEVRVVRVLDLPQAPGVPTL